MFHQCHLGLYVGLRILLTVYFYLRIKRTVQPLYVTPLPEMRTEYCDIYV